MLFSSTVIGMPIVSFETGEKFQTVKDILFDEKQNQIVGFLTEGSSLLSDPQAIRFSDINSIGEDALVVPSSAVEFEVDDDDPLRETLKLAGFVEGKTIMTEDGKDLGKISDVQIDEKSGRIMGYKTSGGIFADIYKGQAIIPSPEVITIGENVVFVPNSTVQLVEEHMGGLKGVAQAASEKAEQVKDTTMNTFSEVKQSATSGELHGTMLEKKDELGKVTQRAKNSAGSLWETVKEKTKELTDDASQKVEEVRIKAALGRPTDRVVLDRNDGVILNAGDLITNESIQRAREAGVLDVLLMAVHKDKPSLSSEEFRMHNKTPRHA